MARLTAVQRLFGVDHRNPVNAFFSAKKIYAATRLASSRIRIADAEPSSKKNTKKASKAVGKVLERSKPRQSVSKAKPTLAKKIQSPDWWKRVPTDDVWIQKYFPSKHYSLKESVDMHRQYAVPEMLNNMSGVVQLNLQLCMKQKRKTKFANSYSGIMIYPHQFETCINQNIVAFSKNLDDIEKALSMGASMAGGVDLINQINSDEVELGNVDVLVATLDILQDLLLIKDKIVNFPSKGKNTTGLPMHEMMKLFTEGFPYMTISKQHTDDPSVGKLIIPIGKLDMPDKHLTENLQVLGDTLSKHRSANLGPIIKEAVCQCPPSSEQFLIRPKELRHESQSVQMVKDSSEKDNEEDLDSDDESPIYKESF